MAPSLFLGEGLVNQLQGSRLLVNLVDTRKEKLVIDNLENLKEKWKDYGWNIEELEDPNHEVEEEPIQSNDHGHHHRWDGFLMLI
jgi:hypothetical protein